MYKLAYKLIFMPVWRILAAVSWRYINWIDS